MSEETQDTPEAKKPDALTTEAAMEILSEVYDPDLGISIVDLGLIYQVKIDGGKVDVDMTLTSPACPYGPQLIGEVQLSLKQTDGVEEVNVELVWDPPWSMDRISAEVKLDLGLDF